MNFHHCCWQFWWIQFLISIPLAWLAFYFEQCSGQKLWDTWITKEACFVIPLGNKVWLSYCSLSVKGTVFSLSRVSQPVYPKANTASVRRQEEFLSTVLLRFVFCLNQLWRHIPICCSRSTALSLTVSMIFISLGFDFNPCLQHPWFPSVLCWEGERSTGRWGRRNLPAG